MGLDMYLSAKKYMSKYFDPADQDKINEINALFGLTGEEDADYGAQEVKFRACYWRKANAIHKWFVDNCQNGVDECQETYVTREQLQELIDLCKEVLGSPKTATNKLPTANGFFFGSTEYDDYYKQDLEYTVTRLEKVLAEPAFAKADFYYQSSW